MQATFEVRRSQFSAFIAALAILAALTLGAVAGYLVRSVATQSATTASVRIEPARSVPLYLPSSVIDPVTGQAYGSAEDQQILATLEKSGYRGGASVEPWLSAGGGATSAPSRPASAGRHAHQLD